MASRQPATTRFGSLGTPHAPSRREWFERAAGGCGALALHALLAGELDGKVAGGIPHHAPRAKRLIFLFMTGGVSHVDSFDPKPKLFADHNQTISVDNFQGKLGEFKMHLKAPSWKFRPGGQSGTEVSDLFPHVRSVVDDLCVIRSMATDHTNHYESTLGMHCGSWTFARPCLGSWVSYGLGTENQNVPAFMVIAPQPPYAGAQTWGSDFLPSSHQGVHITPGDNPVADIRPRGIHPELQRLELDLLQRANRRQLKDRPAESALEARIQSFETAFGMQREVPGALDVAEETADTLKLYGLAPGQTTGFGWQCLVARRLVERGVRFIELIDVGSANNWDAHGDMATHAPLAKNVDRPIAGLIMDLKQRGLLQDTLVVWATEFGRTPYNSAKDAKGREHHHQAFSCWLAGGGVQGGIVHGATDEYGVAVAEGSVHVHDLHATILRLLGLDHERLTFRHAGRDYRLTDVAGTVISSILT